MPYVLGVIITGCGSNTPQIEGKRHSFDFDRREPVLLDEIQQRNLVGDVLEVPTEVLPITPIRSGSDPEYMGAFIKVPQGVQIAVGDRMVRFIHDN
jgi:hypothetical protein